MSTKEDSQTHARGDERANQHEASMSITESLAQTPNPSDTAEAAQALPQSSFVTRHRWLEWLVPAVFCILLFGQLFLSVRRLSQTADESVHIYAGYRALKCADFGFSPEHPPLAKMLETIPFLAMSVKIDCQTPTRSDIWTSLDWLYAQDWEKMLGRARMAASMFAVGLCLLVWIITRRMFGFTTAVVAAALVSFEPNILAHGSLVTTDMPLSFMLLLSVYAFYLWVKNRSARYLLLTGVATGMAFVVKMSGIFVIPILLLLALTDAYLQSGNWAERRKTAVRNLAALALIGVVAIGVLWAAYGFRFSAHPDGSLLPPADAGRSFSVKVVKAVEKARLLPEAYLEGLLRIRMVSGPERPMFLFGRLHSLGRWYFFPSNMLIKYTLAVLALLVMAGFGLRRLFRQHRRELLFIALPGAAFLLITITQNNMNSNIRHVLPVTSFLLVLAAAGSVELAKSKRWVQSFIVGGLLLHAASSLHAFPDYLSYANELMGGPSNAYRMVPMNDWGQSFVELRSYLAQHNSQPCYVATIYMSIPAYGLPCQPIWGGGPFQPIPPHLHGTVVLSSLFLEASKSQLSGGLLSPITKAAPKARIGGSALLVYEGDFDMRLAAGWSQAYAAWWTIKEGRFGLALQYARKGVEEAPELTWVRLQHCRALVANDLFDSAKTECSITRALLFESSAVDRHSVKGVAEAVLAQRALHDGNVLSALEHAKAAVEFAPRSGTAHLVYCRALTANRSLEAEGECENARIFVKNGANPMPNGQYTLDVVRNGMESAAIGQNILDTVNSILFALGESTPAPESQDVGPAHVQSLGGESWRH